MDRKTIVELLRNGMKYSIGRHQLWVSRCFEITVHPNKVIDVDEFESYDEKNGLKFRNGTVPEAKRRDRMYHVGRSVISLKDRQVIDTVPGSGWVISDCGREVLDGNR